MDINSIDLNSLAFRTSESVMVEGGSVGSQRTHFEGREVNQLDSKDLPKADSSETEGNRNSGSSKKRLVLGTKLLSAPRGLPPLISTKGILHTKKRQYNNNDAKEEEVKKARIETGKEKGNAASPSLLSPNPPGKPRTDRDSNLQIASSGWRSPVQHQSLDIAGKKSKRLRNQEAQEGDLNKYWWKRISDSSSLPRTRNLARALEAQEPTWVAKAASAPVVRMRLINVASLEYPTLSHVIWKDPGSLKAVESRKKVMAISGWVLWQIASNNRGFWTLSNTRDVFDLGRRHLYGPRQTVSRPGDVSKSALSWNGFNACEFAARIALSVAGFSTRDLAIMTSNNRIGSHFASLYIETGGQPPNSGHEIEKELLARLTECPSTIKEPTSSPRDAMLKLEGPPLLRRGTDKFDALPRTSMPPPNKLAKVVKPAEPAEPVKPVKPAEPIKQVKPAEPIKPFKLAEPKAVPQKPRPSSQSKARSEILHPEVPPKVQVESWPSTELSSVNKTASLKKMASNKRISGSGLDASVWRKLIKKLESDDE